MLASRCHRRCRRRRGTDHAARQASTLPLRMNRHRHDARETYRPRVDSLSCRGRRRRYADCGLRSKRSPDRRPISVRAGPFHRCDSVSDPGRSVEWQLIWRALRFGRTAGRFASRAAIRRSRCCLANQTARAQIAVTRVENDQSCRHGAPAFVAARRRRLMPPRANSMTHDRPLDQSPSPSGSS